MSVEMKKCEARPLAKWQGCGAIKPISQFPRTSIGGTLSICKSCCYKKGLAWIKTEKGRLAANKRAKRQRDMWKQRLLEQLPPKPDVCEICGNPGRIVLDHDHKTGAFRGWICGRCNTAEGMIGTIASAEKLLAYMRKHSQGNLFGIIVTDKIVGRKATRVTI